MARVYFIVLLGENRQELSIAEEGLPVNDHPTWSPDGSKIAFSRTFQRNCNTWIINADGTGLRQLTHIDEWAKAPGTNEPVVIAKATKKPKAAAKAYLLPPKKEEEGKTAQPEPATAPEQPAKPTSDAAKVAGGLGAAGVVYLLLKLLKVIKL